MTINSTIRKAGPFSGTGFQVAYPFTFKVFGEADMLVVLTDAAGVETPQVRTTNYTVTLNADQNALPGGTINMLVPPPVGYLLTVGSVVQPTQGQSIPNNGGFYPKVIENALDKLTISVQQIAESAARSFKLAFSDTGSPNLPAAAARANKLLSFDANGNPVAVAAASGTATGLQLLLGGANGVSLVGNAADARTLATSGGAGGIGWINAGAGAVFRWLRDKLRETVSPEDFGAVGNGVADDSAAFQAAIDSFASASAGTVRLTPGKTYKVLTGISTNNRNLVIEGNNATLRIGASMTYGLSVISTNCEIRNLTINRSVGVVVTAAVYMTGLQHVLRNVTSRATTWPVFILGRDLKESHFSEIRVDLDPSGRTGTIFQFDYCVNNTMSDSMLGFCDTGIFLSGAPHPTYGYHSEGLMLSNVIIVYPHKAMQIDHGTFIAVSNCCFDFCETQGVFVSNGNTISISNTWIASNVTDGFLGVGSLASVSQMSVIGNFFVRGAAPIASTAGLSLTGTEAVASGNNFQNGMNGGFVTQATSQVFGNTVSGGGTNVSAAATTMSVIGSLSVSEDLDVGGGFTVGGNRGIFPTALSGAATAGANGAPPAQVFAYAVVNLGGTSYKVPLYNV